MFSGFELYSRWVPLFSLSHGGCYGVVQVYLLLYYLGKNYIYGIPEKKNSTKNVK